MKRAPRIGYQTLYLWTCPSCGTVWQPRKRPREGKRLVCRADAEQHVRDHPEAHRIGRAAAGCGAEFESNGSRSGLAN